MVLSALTTRTRRHQNWDALYSITMRSRQRSLVFAMDQHTNRIGIHLTLLPRKFLSREDEMEAAES